MKSLSRLCLLVLALGVGGCGNVEYRPTLSLPEPPAWNSIEMMMMETEIVRAEYPGRKLLPLSSLPTLG